MHLSSVSASESILYRTAAEQQRPFFARERGRNSRTLPNLCNAATQEAIDGGEERHRGLDGHEIPTMALFLGPP